MAGEKKVQATTTERAFDLYKTIIAARQRVQPGDVARGLARGCIQAVEDFDAGCHELHAERVAAAKAEADRQRALAEGEKGSK